MEDIKQREDTMADMDKDDKDDKEVSLLQSEQPEVIMRNFKHLLFACRW
jgi:hypothetical protein